MPILPMSCSSAPYSKIFSVFLSDDAHQLGQLQRKADHAQGMALGLGVAGVEGGDHGAQGEIVGLVQLDQGLLQFAGPLFDHFFQLLLVFPVFQDQSPFFQGLLGDERNLIELEGLGDVVVGALGHGGDRRLDVLDRRDHDDHHVLVQALDFLEQVQAGLPRHADIGHEQVEIAGGLEFF